jgi:hypothetical protein
MLTIFGREPARWIGLIVAILAAVLRLLVGDELISQDNADAVTNLVTKIGDVVLLLLPIIGAELIRLGVTPTAAPAIPAGTTVEVITPGDQPNRSVTV